MPPGPASLARRPDRLVAAASGLRRPALDGPRGTGDERVRDLVADPFADVADAHDRLFALRNHFEATDDRRAAFLTIYARMTAAVAAFIDRGGFHDAEWVSAYLVTFADYYRRAVHDWEAGRTDSVPVPWQLAFEAAERGDTLVVQDAMLGVNAHINYDLALTLADVATTPDRDRKFEDHTAVMSVIRALTDHAQDSLAARDAAGLSEADDALGGLDEWLVAAAIDQCRDSAWRTALGLESGFRPRRQLSRWLNDVTATGGARLILASRSSDRVHRTLRRLERARGG